MKTCNKKFKWIFLGIALSCLLFCISLAISQMNILAYGDKDIGERKIICEATLSDDFADDRIVALMSNKRRKQDDYEVNDFALGRQFRVLPISWDLGMHPMQLSERRIPKRRTPGGWRTTTETCPMSESQKTLVKSTIQ